LTVRTPSRRWKYRCACGPGVAKEAQTKAKTTSSTSATGSTEKSLKTLALGKARRTPSAGRAGATAHGSGDAPGEPITGSRPPDKSRVLGYARIPWTVGPLKWSNGYYEDYLSGCRSVSRRMISGSVIEPMSATEARTAQATGTRRTRASVLIVTILLCSIGLTACARSTARGAEQLTQTAGTRPVGLLPDLGAGEGGWCLIVVGEIGCPSAHLTAYEGPVVMEVWDGHGGGPGGQAGVAEGIVLTTADVAALSLEKRAPVATRREEALPEGFRPDPLKRAAAARAKAGAP
jgi:predicted small secreted protein